LTTARLSTADETLGGVHVNVTASSWRVAPLDHVFDDLDMTRRGLLTTLVNSTTPTELAAFVGLLAEIWHLHFGDIHPRRPTETPGGPPARRGCLTSFNE
jgi:hypothetical protein